MKTLKKHINDDTLIFKYFIPIILSVLISTLVIGVQLYLSKKSHEMLLQEKSYQVSTFVKNNQFLELQQMIQNMSDNSDHLYTISKNEFVVATTENNELLHTHEYSSSIFEKLTSFYLPISLDISSEVSVYKFINLKGYLVRSMIVFFLIGLVLLTSFHFFFRNITKKISSRLTELKKLENALDDLGNKETQKSNYQIKEIQKVSDKMISTFNELKKSQNKIKMNSSRVSAYSMISSFVHDLNNQIVVIRMLFAKLFNFSEEIEREKMKIIRDIEGLTDQVFNQLDSFRQSYKEELFLDEKNLSKTITDALVNIKSLSDKEKNIQLEVDIEDQVNFAHDKNAVIRVIQNLAKNAFKACKEKIKITLQTDGPIIKLHIEDDGEGMDKKDLLQYLKGKKISESKDETGLGLFSCNYIIRLLGGRLFYSTSSFGGARFSINLEEAIC